MFVVGAGAGTTDGADVWLTTSAVVADAGTLFNDVISELLKVPGGFMPLVIDNKSRKLVRVRTELNDCAMDGLIVEISKMDPSRERVPGGDRAGNKDVVLYVLANLKEASVNALVRGPLEGGDWETVGVSELA